jgi:hypothetical protein
MHSASDRHSNALARYSLAAALIRDRKHFLCVVRAENLNPDVLVMQPANQGVRYDASDLLNRAKDRLCVPKT